MATKDKYASVLALGEQLGVRDGRVEEENGVLKVWGTVNTPYEKDQLWDEIKDLNGGIVPNDIKVDIQVSDTSVYTHHTVAKGESLSLIAKHYYKDMMLYTKIFEANRDQLSDADNIKVGQVLAIPNP